MHKPTSESGARRNAGVLAERAVIDHNATPSSWRRIDGVEVMIQQTTATTRGANPLIGSVSQQLPVVRSTKGSGYFPTVETCVRRRMKVIIYALVGTVRIARIMFSDEK